VDDDIKSSKERFFAAFCLFMPFYEVMKRKNLAFYFVLSSIIPIFAPKIKV
jgi:hypothetical protein